MTTPLPAAPAQSATTATTERLALWGGQAPVGDGTTAAEDAFITVHHPATPNGAAVIICPGGGYGCLVVEAEGHGIARWLNGHGITGIVLEYRLPKGRALVPLLDAQEALRVVRANAQAWKLDPQRLGIIGFSAGGHLAASAATLFDAAAAANTPNPNNKPSCRPDFALLIYPVISMSDKGHSGSRSNLLGPEPAPELIERFSTERQVSHQTPPAFLAHAQDDTVVPPLNSQMFHDALAGHRVPARHLKLPSGGHGLNGYKGPSWDAWQTGALEWMNELGIIRR